MVPGKKILQFSLLLTLFWNGCVKDPQDIPAGLTVDPAFGMAGSFDGHNLNLSAGTNGWTMQPLVKDEDSTKVYSSLFTFDGCLEQCTPSWEFRFYRPQSASGDEESVFFQTIKTGSKEFVLSHQERDSFEIRVFTDPALFMSGYSYWENLNGLVTTNLVEYKDVLGYLEPLDVCFQSVEFTGCHYSQCIHFNPATLIPCLASIQPKLEAPYYISLMVRPEGTPPFHIEWYDGSTTSNIVIRLQADTADIYAGVKVTDAKGNRSELNQTIRLRDGSIDACYFPISITNTLVPYLSSAYTADRVEIIYTDQDGVVWSSTSGIQPANSFMTLGSIQYFGLSPMHQAAYKVNLNSSVELFNVTTGESKRLETHDASIALSHR